MNSVSKTDFATQFSKLSLQHSFETKNAQQAKTELQTKDAQQAKDEYQQARHEWT